ncbi:hypothetical protein UN63_01415 [Oceanisphaera arctica]|uniref:Uncharacterized protein n=1 Tax=Oceanisphaera arctica TaxID=641510 RepID=A0A2P5TQY2_9GAMM|nr:hypothetical protein UN63_01415 [Oceanisphaera arctica]GHA12824.1 hypothetical protein GCM10007082_12340 [Oceanisphaera arctica]
MRLRYASSSSTLRADGEKRTIGDFRLLYFSQGLVPALETHYHRTEKPIVYFTNKETNVDYLGVFKQNNRNKD